MGKIVLIIDSSDNKKVRVGLRIGEKIEFISSKNKFLKAQAVLPLIEKILRKHNLKLSDIGKIEVNRGPGSFTGLRVGLAITNTLSFFLGIRVNDKRIGEIEMPEY